jgi:UV DNA damage repair endonuclease
MLRFGLCCIFKNQPIYFRRVTAKYLKTRHRGEQLSYLSSIIKNNAKSLYKALAIKTWNREPLFHISSPQQGWQDSGKQKHADYIDITDFPISWLNLDITIEVEAKAKELAVLKLMKDIQILHQED